MRMNRRGYRQTVPLCEEYGGHLTYTLHGSEPSQDIRAVWHFPCEYKFYIACEQYTGFPPPMPSFPRIVRLTKSTLFNYNYQPCPQAVTNCKGRWGMQDRETRFREMLAMAAVRNPYIRFALGLGSEAVV